MRVEVVKCAVVVATASLLASCALHADRAGDSEPVRLSASAAGERYLEAVCPLNAAWDAVDLEVDRLRLAKEQSVDADVSFFRDAIGSVAKLSDTARQSLIDDGVVWPQEARDAISRVGASLEADATLARDVEKLTPEDIVTFVWPSAETVADSAAEARAALELPEDPVAACELVD